MWQFTIVGFVGGVRTRGTPDPTVPSRGQSPLATTTPCPRGRR